MLNTFVFTDLILRLLEDGCLEPSHPFGRRVRYDAEFATDDMRQISRSIGGWTMSGMHDDEYYRDPLKFIGDTLELCRKMYVTPESHWEIPYAIDCMTRALEALGKLSGEICSDGSPKEDLSDAVPFVEWAAKRVMLDMALRDPEHQLHNPFGLISWNQDFHHCHPNVSLHAAAVDAGMIPSFDKEPMWRSIGGAPPTRARFRSKFVRAAEKKGIDSAELKIDWGGIHFSGQYLEMNDPWGIVPDRAIEFMRKDRIRTVEIGAQEAYFGLLEGLRDIQSLKGHGYAWTTTEVPFVLKLKRVRLAARGEERRKRKLLDRGQSQSHDWRSLILKTDESDSDSVLSAIIEG